MYLILKTDKKQILLKSSYVQNKKVNVIWKVQVENYNLPFIVVLWKDLEQFLKKWAGHWVIAESADDRRIEDRHDKTLAIH